MKRGSAFLILTFLFLFEWSNTLFSETISGKPILVGTWRGVTGEYVAGEILLKVKSLDDTVSVKDLVAQKGSFIIRNFDGTRWSLIGCGIEENIFEKIDIFMTSPLIEWAEPNGIVRPSMAPNDSLFNTD
jgi:hypothetical protein